MSAGITLCLCNHFFDEHSRKGLGVSALFDEPRPRCDRCSECPGFMPRKLKIPLRLVVDNTKKGAA